MTRLLAIDWMRGIVMILMTLDHASQFWNAGRTSADSAYLKVWGTGDPVWVASTPIDTAQFFTRFVTHLCAPTFLFLAGTALAISIARRVERGATAWTIDRHLAIRALVILSFEALLSLLAFPGMWILQVLYAIGFSMLAMILLRRVKTTWLVVGALCWFVGGEWLTMRLFPLEETFVPVWGRMLFAPANAFPIMSIYPALHWLAILVLGQAFGRFVVSTASDESGAESRQRIIRTLVLWGIAGIFVFVVVRAANAYGNMGLLRDDGALVQWLHVSKYPPSLTFIALELGLMALILAGLFALERRTGSRAQSRNPVTVFGQTALFFYVLHFVVIGASSEIFGNGGMAKPPGGIREAFVVATLCLVALYPICLGYRAVKRRHPRSVLQYL